MVRLLLLRTVGCPLFFAPDSAAAAFHTFAPVGHDAAGPASERSSRNLQEPGRQAKAGGRRDCLFPAGRAAPVPHARHCVGSIRETSAPSARKNRNSARGTRLHQSSARAFGNVLHAGHTPRQRARPGSCEAGGENGVPARRPWLPNGATSGNFRITAAPSLRSVLGHSPLSAERLTSSPFPLRPNARRPSV